MKKEKAVFAGGCFWCTEAIFQRIKGVEEVLPGYTGGTVENPTYEEVSSGTTGHAEAIQITFDSSVVSYKTLLEVFFKTHDPTTRNQQGADRGTQYRSVIFYLDEEQKRSAEEILEVMQSKVYPSKKIVTEIVPFTKFFVAEDYHKNYFNTHKEAPYCSVVIDPKVKKLIDTMPELVQ
jgi:peptide-methionine (S)-S-oxide reductase